MKAPIRGDAGPPSATRSDSETATAAPAADPAFLDLAHGDVGVAKHFRSSLETLREHTTDPGFRRLVDEILAGRKSPRALAGSAAFDRVVAPGLAEATAHLAALSPEDKAQLEEQGRQELAALATDE